MQLRAPQGGHRTNVERHPPRSQGASRYLNRSAKPKLLETAVEVATERGYEALRISDITDPVGVQRQAFYAHFRDKRHCLCEAIDPRLAVIERMAASGSEDDAEWSKQLLKTVDEVLFERFESKEGTKGRLTAALREMLEEKGSVAAVKVSDLVKAAHVPQGDFYRHFSGKKECFGLLYLQLLREVEAELAAELDTEECPAEHTSYEVPTWLGMLGEVLVADRARLDLLVFGISELPDQPSTESLGAWQGSLGEMVSELLDVGTPQDSFVAGSVVEVVRSSVLDDVVRDIPMRLEVLGERLPRESPSVAKGTPAQPLAA